MLSLQLVSSIPCVSAVVAIFSIATISVPSVNAVVRMFSIAAISIPGVSTIVAMVYIAAIRAVVAMFSIAAFGANNIISSMIHITSLETFHYRCACTIVIARITILNKDEKTVLSVSVSVTQLRRCIAIQYGTHRARPTVA